MEYFHKLNLATGAAINLENTAILSLNTDNTSYLQENLPNLTIKEQHQDTKILRIIFSEDVKEAIMQNWQKVLQ